MIMNKMCSSYLEKIWVLKFYVNKYLTILQFLHFTVSLAIMVMVGSFMEVLILKSSRLDLNFIEINQTIISI